MHNNHVFNRIIFNQPQNLQVQKYQIKIFIKIRRKKKLHSEKIKLFFVTILFFKMIQSQNNKE